MRDDIKTEYHPNACRDSVIEHFEDYGRTAPSPQYRPGEKPWAPFRNRLDYELAELIFDCAMNSKQTNRLIALIQRCATGSEQFTIKDDKELKETWKLAGAKCAEVRVWSVV